MGDDTSVDDFDSTMPNDSSEGGDAKPCKLVRENAFMGKESYKRSINLSLIRLIIENDFRGQTMLSTYRKTKMLTQKSINLIVDIIISECLKHYDR
ncbi:hypothetical protein PV325_012529, partial [Microctonus aethiopoides]